MYSWLVASEANMLSFVLKTPADAENQCELERYIYMMDSITALYYLFSGIFSLCREAKFVFISQWRDMQLKSLVLQNHLPESKNERKLVWFIYSW